MILDTLNNANLYTAILPGLSRALAFARSVRPDIEDGRIELPESTGFALVMSYNTESADTHKMETHRRYADLQVMLSGREMMQWAPVSALQELDPYNEDNDVGFWKDGPSTELIIGPGMFVFYLPGDAHKPNCSIDSKVPAAVKKLVVKVPVNR